MRVAIGNDHAGVDLRNQLAADLRAEGHTVDLYGATDTEPYDYPLAADAVAQAVLNHTDTFGVLVCGSGVGVCIRANRYPGIRAAQCFDVEMAQLARRHNHANVLCIGERIQSYADAKTVVEAFLTTEEDHAPRHDRRVALIDAPLKP